MPLMANAPSLPTGNRDTFFKPCSAVTDECFTVLFFGLNEPPPFQKVQSWGGNAPMFMAKTFEELPIGVDVQRKRKKKPKSVISISRRPGEDEGWVVLSPNRHCVPKFMDRQSSGSAVQYFNHKPAHGSIVDHQTALCMEFSIDEVLLMIRFRDRLIVTCAKKSVGSPDVFDIASALKPYYGELGRSSLSDVTVTIYFGKHYEQDHVCRSLVRQGVRGRLIKTCFQSDSLEVIRNFYLPSGNAFGPKNLLIAYRDGSFR